MSGFFDILSKEMEQDDQDQTKLQKFGKNFSNGLIAGGATLGGAAQPQQPQQPGQAPKPKSPSEAAQSAQVPLPQVPNLQLNKPQMFAPAAAVPQIPQVQMPVAQIPAPQLQMPQMSTANPMLAPAQQYADSANLQMQIPAAYPQLGQPQSMIYSDRNLKTNISNTSKSDIKKFMNSISKPKSYDYKDSANGTHTEGGLMAQDLEKSKIGKSVVINTPKGKAVNTAKLAAIMASTTANRLNEFERKLEKALNDKFKKGNK